MAAKAQSVIGVERPRASEYLDWVKTQPPARYDLATSGVAPYALADLPVAPVSLDLPGPSGYGSLPVIERIARKSGVPVESVMATNGCSMANHLVMAALINPGDDVLIEQPAYEPLLATARYLGARVLRFERRPDAGFRVDPRTIASLLTRRTRLIVLTNPHHPSSVLTERLTLREVGRLAETVGARLLVDEVHLDAFFDRAPTSAAQLDSRFIVTSSLTKAYGLGDLRCGWVVADAGLIHGLWRLNALFGVASPKAAERSSVAAFDELDAIRTRARSLLDANHALVNDFLARRDELVVPPVKGGTVAFPRLVGADADEFCTLLRLKYETSVVPGRFFELQDHFRLGLGGPTDILREGLTRLGQALDEL